MQLKRKLQNQNPTESDSNLKAQISGLTNQLKEKTEELEESENLNNVLTVKELITRKELHDAREESISVYYFNFHLLVKFEFMLSFFFYLPKIYLQSSGKY